MQSLTACKSWHARLVLQVLLQHYFFVVAEMKLTGLSMCYAMKQQSFTILSHGLGNVQASHIVWVLEIIVFELEFVWTCFLRWQWHLLLALNMGDGRRSMHASSTSFHLTEAQSSQYLSTCTCSWVICGYLCLVGSPLSESLPFGLFFCKFLTNKTRLILDLNSSRLTEKTEIILHLWKLMSASRSRAFHCSLQRDFPDHPLLREASQSNSFHSEGYKASENNLSRRKGNKIWHSR